MFKTFKIIVTLGTKKISVKSMTNPFLTKFNFSVSLAKYSYAPVGFTSDRYFSVTNEPLSVPHKIKSFGLYVDLTPNLCISEPPDVFPEQLFQYWNSKKFKSSSVSGPITY